MTRRWERLYFGRSDWVWGWSEPVWAYVRNNPQNRVDPSGLCGEIDVHYYLTYFIASRFPCLTADEARLIADADQSTDESAATSPELGLTLVPDSVTGARIGLDSRVAQFKNETYHGLHPGSHQPYLESLWKGSLKELPKLRGTGSVSSLPAGYFQPTKVMH